MMFSVGPWASVTVQICESSVNLTISLRTRDRHHGPASTLSP